MKNISAERKFLRELSMVERAQREAVIIGISVENGEARVQVRDGSLVLLPLPCDRQHIAQALRQEGIGVDPPYRGEPGTYPDRPTVEQTWCELLDDLGSYLDELNHADPELRLVAVHRNASAAHVDVTNGFRDFTHVVRLDSQEMPANVPVEIAAAFGATSRAG